MSGGFGLFGKLPVKGDFLRVNLPPGFERVWDDWQQGLVVAGRETFGQAWQARFLEAPIWRFTLAGGLAGSAPILGAMAPSVDRVGRQFPLTLVTPCRRDLHPLDLHLAGDGIFTELEEIALAAVTEDTALDVVMDHLRGLPAPAAAGGVALERYGDGFTARGDLGLVLGRAWMNDAVQPGSLWTAATPGRDRIHLVFPGLPPGGAAGAFFPVLSETAAGSDP